MRGRSTSGASYCRGRYSFPASAVRLLRRLQHPPVRACDDDQRPDRDDRELIDQPQGDDWEPGGGDQREVRRRGHVDRVDIDIPLRIMRRTRRYWHGHALRTFDVLL